MRDPGERENIAGDRPRTVRDLRVALDELTGGSTLEVPLEVSEEVVQRLRSLGYLGGGVNVAPETAGDTLPDPKDKVAVLEQYRLAVDLAGQRRFSEAIGLLEEIVTDSPAMTDVWQQLGNLQVRAGRFQDSVRSYSRVVELRPTDPTGLIAVAASLLKLRELDEAWAHAREAVEIATPENVRALAGTHELLVKIALAREDREAAHRHAALAEAIDPTLPLPTYVRARMLHAEGEYARALPLFEETLRRLRSRTVTLTEVHFYTGDTLARLERSAEAEAQFREELRLTPHNARARASLAMLYRSQGRDAQVEQEIANLVAAVPTPEGYGLAAKLWNIFGEPDRAAAVLARAREQFADDPTLPALENSPL